MYNRPGIKGDFLIIFLDFGGVGFSLARWFSIYDCARPLHAKRSIHKINN